MIWPGPVVEAEFLRRYKRFLADFRLTDGTIVTAHCANTGSMKTCFEEGAPAWLTYHDDPRRKLAYSWQAIRMPDGWVGINTALANALVDEALQKDLIAECRGYLQRMREKPYDKGSRVDFLLRGKGLPDCYIEVKNVTLLLSPGVAGFPDAVTQRGTRHLEALTAMAAQGHRAVLLYCVQRMSVNRVQPAEAFDPQYARTLKAAVAQGLEVLAYRADLSQQGLTLAEAIPVAV